MDEKTVPIAERRSLAGYGIPGRAAREEVYSYAPPRRTGTIFLSLVGLVFLAAGLLALSQLLRAPLGALFVFYLLSLLLSVGIVPAIIYRLLALRGAYYTIQRNGLRLHWGLRVEDIPMTQIQWIKTIQEVHRALGRRLPLPTLRGLGSFLGVRKLGDGTLVEYIAADLNRMLLISTPGRAFVISPADVEEFLYVYDRFTELGTVAEYPARSVYPSLLLSQVWNSRLASILLGVGLLLSLALLTWVSLVIPSLNEVYLTPFAIDPLPPGQLLLLPLLNGLYYLSNSLAGLYFFRRSLPVTEENERTPRRKELLAPGWLFAYILWANSILTALLFLGAVFFITYGI